MPAEWMETASRAQLLQLSQGLLQQVNDCTPRVRSVAVTNAVRQQVVCPALHTCLTCYAQSRQHPQSVCIFTTQVDLVSANRAAVSRQQQGSEAYVGKPDSPSCPGSTAGGASPPADQQDTG
jgi:6-phosphogluconate dehydrogenase